MNNKLLSITQLDTQTLLSLFERAKALKDIIQHNKVLNTLSGKIIANLFFEPSTRTLNSFEIAAKRLGAFVLNTRLDTSSLAKGETVFDMVKNLEAMGASVFIIRHSNQKVIEEMSQQLNPQTTLINVGGGEEEHPSQALLDLFTISCHKPHFHHLTIAMIGDIRHSRVAHSFISAITKFGKPNIRLIAPLSLVPSHLNNTISVINNIEEGLKGADVVICLRLQKERIDEKTWASLQDFSADYCLTEERLQYAKPDVIVMHPGPMNRGVEISNAVADGKQSIILEQVNNGVAIRMALLELLSSVSF